MAGSEKNKGTVITSLQLASRRRDRNFTPFTIHYLRNSAGDEKHGRRTFSIDIACLQISPFKAVILHSFWAIPPKKKRKKNIGKHS